MAIALMIGTVACVKWKTNDMRIRDADQTVYLDDRPIQLLGIAHSKSAYIDKTVVSGELSSDDKTAISVLVGRIPNIPASIEAINVISTIEVKIWVRGYEIDAVKDSQGSWSISDFFRCRH